MSCSLLLFRRSVARLGSRLEFVIHSAAVGKQERRARTQKTTVAQEETSRTPTAESIIESIRSVFARSRVDRWVREIVCQRRLNIDDFHMGSAVCYLLGLNFAKGQARKLQRRVTLGHRY